MPLAAALLFFHQVFVKWTLHVFWRASSQLFPGIKILKIDSVDFFLDLIEVIEDSKIFEKSKIRKFENSKIRKFSIEIQLFRFSDFSKIFDEHLSNRRPKYFPTFRLDKTERSAAERSSGSPPKSAGRDPGAIAKRIQLQDKRPWRFAKRRKRQTERDNVAQISGVAFFG